MIKGPKLDSTQLPYSVWTADICHGAFRNLNHAMRLAHEISLTDLSIASVDYESKPLITYAEGYSRS